MEEKKILVGMPCSRRLEIVGTGLLTPFLVSFLIMILDHELNKKQQQQQQHSDNSKNNKGQ